LSTHPIAIFRSAARVIIGLLLVGLLTTPRASAVDLTDRPIADIRYEGLKDVPQQLVSNQVRLVVGGPYDPKVVEQDIVRITHLGRFSNVKARVEPRDDGTVVVTYVVQEQPLIAAVQVVGNKEIPDHELLQRVVLRAGDPADPFLIDRAIKQIKRAYEEAGFFVTDVSIDQASFDESRILIFRVREGPRVRIRQIRFRGNHAFSDSQLRSKIKSRTYVFIFRKGELNRDELDADAARVRQFYEDSGYLDARVGRRIDLSPDQKDAVAEFLIEEGPRYTVRSLQVQGVSVFSEAQVIETMALRAGDIYSADLLRKSQEALTDLYGKLGFIDTKVQIDRLKEQDQVDLVVRIEEFSPYLVGKVEVRGNQVTQDKVIYRQVRGMTPNRRFDRSGIELTEQRLRESALFSDAKVTILGDPKDEYRDVLVEVKETNTGSLSFGAGISSDSGLIGAIDLTQRNFDIANPPSKFEDLFTGKAFRGAGQYFALAIQPGTETSRYSVTFREPYVFDTEYLLDTTAFLFEREREKWDEERIGSSVRVGQRFGDVWSASTRLRAERITINQIQGNAPVDVFDVEGTSTLTSLGFQITRNATDSQVFPTRGSRIQIEYTHAGALGGAYDFDSIEAQVAKYWTIDEDFFGRRSVVSLRVEMGYIFQPDEAPTFERFYAGGHRSFRGFALRGVGPRGIRADTGLVGDDPVGANWMFLAGLEYNFPIYEEVIRGVVFIDTGTVEPDVGFNDYRASIGGGFRFKLPFLGQAPFAIDFATPLAQEDGDEPQVFSFDLALPWF
jgi:outer membrane protein insertion porin family